MLRWPCTCQLRIGAAPRPWPVRMEATVSRSSATVFAVASESSAPGIFTPCRVPAFSRVATSRSASAIVTAPGAWASAAAKRSARANTASRSERCAIAQATASTAGDGDGPSAPASRADRLPLSLAGPRSPGGTFMAAPPGCRAPPTSLSPRTAGSRVLPDPVAGSAAASRSGEPDFPAASATSARASRPRSADWRSQTPRSSPRSMSRFPARVISEARSARRGLSADVPSPRSAIAASISARRVENASIV